MLFIALICSVRVDAKVVFKIRIKSKRYISDNLKRWKLRIKTVCFAMHPMERMKIRCNATSTLRIFVVPKLMRIYRTSYGAVRSVRIGYVFQISQSSSLHVSICQNSSQFSEASPKYGLYLLQHREDDQCLWFC